MVVVTVITILHLIVDKAISAASEAAIIKAGIGLELIGVITFLHILLNEVVAAGGR